MDRKYFMGVAQVALDELDLSGIVIGWYKLFTTSSLAEHRGQNDRRPTSLVPPSANQSTEAVNTAGGTGAGGGR